MFWERSLLLIAYFVYGFCYSPVVIVPGTGGNQLQAKLVGKPEKPAWYCYSTTSSYFTLWLDIKSLLPYSINCWVDNMRLQWDMKGFKVENSPGVLTRTFDFGETSSLETVDSTGFIKYMKPFVEYLVSLGYKRGKDIRGAPYDFRYSPERMPDDYHSKLKKLIEETYTINGKVPVTLISHSYGCAVTLYFLSTQNQQWKSKYLKQWIPLSGVFGGTMQQVQLYAAGLLMGVPEAIVSPLQVRGEQRTSVSNLYMLPAQPAFASTYVIAKTTTRVYTLNDIDQFLNDVDFPNGALMRKHITNSTELMQTSPGVPMHCFYGVIKESTVSSLEYNGNFPDKPSKMNMGDGDGTVNYESLRLCGDFQKNQNEVVSVMEIPGVDHNGVLSDANVLKTIGNLLK